jgi:hypothetical protein
MGKRDVTVGSKEGFLVKARFLEPKDKDGNPKNPCIEFIFEFKEPSTDGIERLPWTAYLSEKATVNSFNRMTDVLGWNGDVKSLEQVDQDGWYDPEGTVFAFRKEVELDVQEKIYNGKAYNEIAWVNRTGSSDNFGCSPEKVAGISKRLGLVEAMAQIRSASSPTKEETQAAKPAVKTEAKKELVNHAKKPEGKKLPF